MHFNTVCCVLQDRWSVWPKIKAFTSCWNFHLKGDVFAREGGGWAAIAGFNFRDILWQICSFGCLHHSGIRSSTYRFRVWPRPVRFQRYCGDACCWHPLKLHPSSNMYDFIWPTPPGGRAWAWKAPPVWTAYNYSYNSPIALHCTSLLGSLFFFFFFLI